MNKEFFYIGVISLAIIVTLTAIMYLLLVNIRESQRNRYNHGMNRIEYDKMRDYYEGKIYEINKQLMDDKERWLETNHLIINGNSNIIDNENINKSVLEPNKFLKKHGLTNKDMKINNNEVFVLTSFIEEYRETYYTIKNVCEEMTLKCSKSDEEYIENDILNHILKKMARARIIIANIDGRNPNVYYELGIAHTLDKPTIMVSKNLNEIPFDLQSKNILFYKNQEDLERKLMIEINKAVLNREL